MHVNHVISASGPRGVKADVAYLTGRLRADPKEGGFHPQFRTQDCIIPLADPRYLEVMEALDHSVAAKVPSGQVVRARSGMDGGWSG